MNWAVDLAHLHVHRQQRLLLAVDQLQIRAGERVAILGPNGAGKSTLLRLIAGSLAPDIPPRAGRDSAEAATPRLRVLGSDLLAPIRGRALRDHRRKVGLIHQTLPVVARLTALDNALIGGLGNLAAGPWPNRAASWVRHYPNELRVSAMQALEQLGLAPLAANRADQLSGGERQKLALARLLVQQPQLILADEPTSALDPAAAQEMSQRLGGLAGPRREPAPLSEPATDSAAYATTLISVIHHPDLLPALADRVLGMRHGRIVWDQPRSRVDEQALAQLYA